MTAGWRRSSLPPRSVRLDEPLRRQRQQLGYRFDVPIGEADLHMTQIGGELGQLAPDVHTRSVPLDDPSRRKGVTEILQPRPTAPALRTNRAPQPDLARQLGEHVPSGRPLDASATLGEEKRLTGGPDAQGT